VISPRDLIHVGQGILMGGADIIPGVSGGTVALILGIYERLVTAISHFDLTFLKHLRRREWAAAAKHVDLLFLVLLGSGIATGIVLLASLMHWLLENQLQHTFASFFGMILASTYIVWRMIKRKGIDVVLLILTGAAVAYWLVGLPFLEDPPIGRLYVFACGIIAICAMILPGISGSFILLLLGTYSVVTGLLRDLLKGRLTDDTWLLLFFAAGAGIGLLGFSKFLKWLLARYEAATMAVLCGFRLYSLRKIWPYKRVLNPEATKFEDRFFENIWPDFGDINDGLSLVILVTAGGLVLLLELVSQRREPAGDLKTESPQT
jgi:putative membrane protein